MEGVSALHLISTYHVVFEWFGICARSLPREHLPFPAR